MSKSFWLVSAGLFALAAPAHAQDQTSPTGETSPVEQAGEWGGDEPAAAGAFVGSMRFDHLYVFDPSDDARIAQRCQPGDSCRVCYG